MTDCGYDKVFSEYGWTFAQVAVFIKCICVVLGLVASHLLEFFDSYFKISQIVTLGMDTLTNWQPFRGRALWKRGYSELFQRLLSFDRGLEL